MAKKVTGYGGSLTVGGVKIPIKSWSAIQEIRVVGGPNPWVKMTNMDGKIILRPFHRTDSEIPTNIRRGVNVLVKCLERGHVRSAEKAKAWLQLRGWDFEL